MSNVITQGSTRSVRVLMVAAADHLTGLIGATLNVYISKEGQVSFSFVSRTVTELGYGWYNIVLTSADTDTIGNLTVHVTAVGGDPADLNFTVTDYSDVSNAVTTNVERVGGLLDNLPTLSEIEASVVLAKEVTVLTRLAAVDYTTPLTANETTAAIWDVQSTDHTAAGTTGLFLNQINSNAAAILIDQTTIINLINTTLKYERNRTKIDTVNATLTVYDNDCVTPLTIFSLKDHLGNPSVQEVCERVPDTCP